MKVEEFELLKQPSEEIIEEIQTIIDDMSESDSLEDIGLSTKGYALVDIGSDEEINEGKYVYGCGNYQLVSFDDSKLPYPTEKNTITRYNLFVSQGYGKCGSYFTEYEWFYDTPTMKRAKIEVIPEHKEIKFTIF